MSGFADLIPDAMPALFGAGCNTAGTEGRSWRWSFAVLDNSGAAIDLSTGYTFDCRILTGVDGTAVVTPTVTGGVGTLTITAPPSGTAGKAAGQSRRQCRWTLTITETSSSSQVQVWGPTNSRFTIEAE